VRRQASSRLRHFPLDDPIGCECAEHKGRLDENRRQDTSPEARARCALLLDPTVWIDGDPPGSSARLAPNPRSLARDRGPRALVQAIRERTRRAHLLTSMASTMIANVVPTKDAQIICIVVKNTFITMTSR
jgi:hypothetical protein